VSDGVDQTNPVSPAAKSKNISLISVSITLSIASAQ